MATDPEVIRVSLVGPPKGGKTTLLARIVCRRHMQTISTPEAIAAESVVFAVKKAAAITPSHDVTFDVGDTHGDVTKFQLQYASSDVIVVVFDLTSRESFNDITRTVHVIRSCNSASRIVLAGNKCELHLDRIVERLEAKILAGDLHVPYIEVSGKENMHINELLHLVAISRSTGHIGQGLSDVMSL